MNTTTLTVLLSSSLILGACQCDCAKKTEPAPQAAAAPAGILAHDMNRLDGTPASLSTYGGQVILIVNTASKCGLTPQYAGLEALYRSRKDQGFVVLGFPANDFRGQEPLSNAEIATFCTGTYDVTFPMFEKIVVTGDDAHPLYKELTALPAPAGGAPSWNFTKYLVDRHGRVLQRFDPRTAPDDPALLAAIDQALAGS
jgi:glutathione peroxidase